MKFQFASLALFVLASSVSAVEYLASPTTAWAGSVAGNIEAGNSVSVTPDDLHVVTTTSNGIMYVNLAADGSSVTTVTPGDVGLLEDVVCTSGVEFFEYDGSTYAVYAVYHEPTNKSYIVYASGEGFETKQASQELKGKAVGTPVVSSDGALVYINSNVNNLGIFNVLLTSTKAHFFIDENAWDSTRAVSGRFGPIGIYHNPSEGFYNIDNKSGVGNTNDILFWANDLPIGATGNQGGARYVFQAPIGWSDGDSAAGFDVLPAQVNGWSTETAPALWNQGKSAIFGVTRNAFKAWVQYGGDDPKWQDGFNAEVAATSDGRGFPRWSAPRTTPVVTADDGSGYIVAGLAGAGPNSPALHILSAADLSVINTFNVGGAITEAIYAQPVLSLDKDVVFWMSSGENLLHATDLPPNDKTGVQSKYTVPLDSTNKVEGHMSLSSDGVYLYIGDTDGNLAKYAVAEEGTGSPTASPAPSMTPTASPTVAPVAATPAPTTSAKPSAAASEAPSVGPTSSSAPTLITDAPTVSPTVKDSMAPSTIPTALPTPSPVPETPAPVAPVPVDTPGPSASPTPEESESPTSSSAAVSTMFTLCAAVAAALYL